MGQYTITCARCGQAVPSDVYHRVCPACGGELAFHYGLSDVRLDRDLPGIWRFIDLLPMEDPAGNVSLGEGNTPLIPSNLAEPLGIRLAWKWEGVNPTGAQKDRGLAVAIAKGREFGFDAAIIASTGSAGLSSAAYAARAGMQHAVLVSRNAPLARVAPMATLGSTVFEVEGTIEDTLELLAAAADHLGAYETTTYRRANPYQSEGAKTLAYEIFLQHGGVPDWVVVPVGGGGTLGSIWRGFGDLHDLGLIDRFPRIAGVQPADYDALRIAEREGLSTDAELRHLVWGDLPPTILVKLQHTYPYDGEEALAAIRRSGGAVSVATDEEALAAQRRIGGADGLYAEPSSTVVLTAIEELLARGAIEPGQSVVAVLTGSGHRETHVLVERGEIPVEVITRETGEARLARFLQEASSRRGAA
ncbi:MAG TPA: pyridoxal-phosphate dependent enzyme [Thermomicrobiales bacterium]|nr:pyridoxal-phosphate dependent enzyme [Thermomicrobiales bacterium]